MIYSCFLFYKTENEVNPAKRTRIKTAYFSMGKPEARVEQALQEVRNGAPKRKNEDHTYERLMKMPRESGEGTL